MSKLAQREHMPTSAEAEAVERRRRIVEAEPGCMAWLAHYRDVLLHSQCKLGQRQYPSGCMP